MNLSRRRWIWIGLFVVVASLLGTLATGWNVLLVEHYYRFRDLGVSISPTMNLVLGTLGFVVVLLGLVLLFFRLLHEMKLNQLQSEFLAAVSHELKTPIATATLSASLLRSGELTSEETQQLWDSHDRELKRLQEGVESLLESARWESHSVFLNRRSVSMEEWISNSLNRWKERLGPNARLVRDGQKLNCTALIDPRLLNLITDNLINNSKKFCKDIPEVEIRSRITKGRWQIQFRDCGWGFHPSDKAKIFRRFFRAPSAAPYAIPGTGLGLYLAASASRAMGLKLYGESDGPGRGAIFTLEGRVLG